MRVPERMCACSGCFAARHLCRALVTTAGSHGVAGALHAGHVVEESSAQRL